MTKVKEIIDYMNSWASPELALSWDNCGSQLYFPNETDSVVIAMDMHDVSLQKAIETDSKLIITHHPFFFSGVKNILSGDYKSDLIIEMIKRDISLYSAHTTLDIAEGGVNDVLCEVLGIIEAENLSLEEEKNIGLIGNLKNSLSFEEFLDDTVEKLEVKNPRAYGRSPKRVQRVAVLGGSGFSSLDDAIKKGADVLISSDLKYHDGQEVYEKGACVLDLGHFYSERPVLYRIKERLNKKFENLNCHLILNSTFEI